MTPANKQAVKPVRTYVRQAANKPAIISGLHSLLKARTAGKTWLQNSCWLRLPLASLYAILPPSGGSAQNKADRKVGMYLWLADEGHVGIRSTKSSIDRRDLAQELVCKNNTGRRGL